MRKTIGLTLLEMLLVLVIGASIVTLAVRYFTVSHRAMQVQQAMTQIKHITRASYTWLNTRRQVNFSDAENGQTISLNQLIDSNLITPEQTIDPWGKPISLAPASDPSRIKIGLPGIPIKACRNLQRKLTRINQSKIFSTCHAKLNTFYGVF